MANDDIVNFDYLYKYIIIGDAYVGKSNLLLRYAHGQFRPDYQLTIGVEFGAKNIKIKDKIYRIQIWDTAGTESFRSVTRGYYKSSVCALVVYDIANRESFNNINDWIEDCKNQSPKTIFFVLVGNKSDLEDKRQIMKEDGEEKAKSFNLGFIETSACSGDNIDQAFDIMLKEVLKKYVVENDINDEFEASGGKNIELDKKDNKTKKKKCC